LRLGISHFLSGLAKRGYYVVTHRMKDDAELLRAYAETRSETAFAEFVERRIGFVYATALRTLAGNAHTAQDVTQKVFVLVANKSAALARHERLAGWLHTTTCNLSLKLVREACRRDAREQEAARMSEIEQSATAEIAVADAAKLRPMLDEALGALREGEREAVLLRYFEGMAFAGIGVKLKMSDEAARKCVARAVEKMRAAFAKRGVTSSASALGALMTAEAAQTAPSGLAASVSTGAMAAGGAAAVAGMSAGAIASAFLSFMSSTKITTAAVAALLVAAGGIYYGVQNERAASAALARARHENVTLAAQLRALEKQNAAASAAAAKPDPVAAGRALLAEHPEIGEKLAAMKKAFGARFSFRIAHEMNLSPEQSARLAEIEGRIFNSFNKRTFFAPGYGTVSIDISDGKKSYDADELRALLGEDGYKDWKHWRSLQVADNGFTSDYGNGLSSELSSALYFTDEPLTSRQAWSLDEIATDLMKNPAGFDANNVQANWSALVERAKPVLSPQQMHALVGLGDQYVWHREQFQWFVEFNKTTKFPSTRRK